MQRLNPEQIQKACELLHENMSVTSVELRNVIWKKIISSSIAELLVRNATLTTLVLEGTPNEEEQKEVISGLMRNMDIRKFSMQCSEENQAIIRRLLERNAQLRTSVNFLIDELLQKIDCGQDEDLKEIVQQIHNARYSSSSSAIVGDALFKAFIATHSRYPQIAELIQTLRDTKINPLRTAGKIRGLTALHATASENLPEYTSALLEMGVSTEARTYAGNTALHYAAFFGNTKVAKILCKNGADTQAENLQHQTPAALAAQNGHPEIEKYLNQYSAHPKHGRR